MSAQSLGQENVIPYGKEHPTDEANPMESASGTTTMEDASAVDPAFETEPTKAPTNAERAEQRYSRLVRAFSHHSPSKAQVTQIEALRNQYLDLAKTVLDICPSPTFKTGEKDIALEKLDESCRWAIAAIVRPTL